MDLELEEESYESYIDFVVNLKQSTGGDLSQFGYNAVRYPWGKNSKKVQGLRAIIPSLMIPVASKSSNSLHPESDECNKEELAQELPKQIRVKYKYNVFGKRVEDGWTAPPTTTRTLPLPTEVENEIGLYNGGGMPYQGRILKKTEQFIAQQKIDLEKEVRENC